MQFMKGDVVRHMPLNAFSSREILPLPLICKALTRLFSIFFSSVFVFFFQRVGQHDAADFSVATGAQLPPYLLVIQKKKTKKIIFSSLMIRCTLL
jgi:hypothetical protein